jgi:hypothetical protein
VIKTLLNTFRAQKTIKKSTKGELIISGSVSDNELTAKSDSDTEVEAEEPEDKQTFEKNKTSRELNELKELKDSYNNKLNTESGFRQILLLWRESVISIKEFLREIPKDQFQQWLNTVSLKGKVRCPLEVCLHLFGFKLN